MRLPVTPTAHDYELQQGRRRALAGLIERIGRSTTAAILQQGDEETDGMNRIVQDLKARKEVIMQRLYAFNRRFRHYDPTLEELAVFERDKRAVMAINCAIEREDAARRPLTRADIEAEIQSILRQEQEVMYRGGQRRRR
jgi:hypothetical protein